MNKLASLCSLLSVGAVAACTSYDPDLGDVPFTCDPALPICPEGYACGEISGRNVCVSTSGIQPDASPGGFQCASDGSLEPNDTTMNAFQTPLSTSMTMLTYGPLSICPEGDKDHYAVNIMGGNPSIEAIVTWESGDPVTVAILGQGGMTIGAGSPMGNNAVRACVANLPMGTYFAAASAGPTTQNNYRISIKLLANCAGG